MFEFQRPTNDQISFKGIENFISDNINIYINIYFNFIITMIALLITIHTVLILIAIFVANYIIECKIENLKNELSRQEIVDYINDMDVYVRDKQGNILKHHAHISGFNSDDYTKIIIDVK